MVFLKIYSPPQWNTLRFSLAWIS